jgi:hypothetical protein
VGRQVRGGENSPESQSTTAMQQNTFRRAWILLLLLNQSRGNNFLLRRTFLALGAPTFRRCSQEKYKPRQAFHRSAKPGWRICSSRERSQYGRGSRPVDPSLGSDASRTSPSPAAAAYRIGRQARVCPSACFRSARRRLCVDRPPSVGPSAGREPRCAARDPRAGAARTVGRGTKIYDFDGVQAM